MNADQKAARRRERYAKRSVTITARRRELYAQRSEAQKAADAEKRRQSRARRRERRIAEYGKPPACECGCGLPVGFNREGRPNRYAVGHYLPDGDAARGMQFNGERVPTARAAAALEKLRVQHGWSVHRMAKLGGVNYSTLHKIMRDPHYAREHGVDADMLRRMLIKLSGRERPTAEEMQRMHAREQSVKLAYHQ